LKSFHTNSDLERSVKVLLVDDSGVMRKIIARALHALWIEDVVEAADGLEAVAAFGDGVGFDLILTDWNMPNMNGLELVTAIRGAGHKLPIIMVTTETEKGQVLKAIQAGINDYLVKPFDQETLIAKLEKALPNYQPG
jgi:two-component system, chemotaxis family, chemotaxis protein CheY